VTAPEARQFIVLLVAKLAALEARLNQNPQNLSKPPSSAPPAAPPRPTKTRRGKPKPKGAQLGHHDQQRDLLPETEVDTVVPLHPTACPRCQEPLAPTLRSIELPQRQQIFELPEVKPLVTEYQFHSVCCPGCGDLVTASRPADVRPGAFGPWVVALIALLHGRYRTLALPSRRVAPDGLVAADQPRQRGQPPAGVQRGACPGDGRGTGSTPTRRAGARARAKPGCGWRSVAWQPCSCSSMVGEAAIAGLAG